MTRIANHDDTESIQEEKKNGRDEFELNHALHTEDDTFVDGEDKNDGSYVPDDHTVPLPKPSKTFHTQ